MKKYISLLLAVCMVFSISCISASAYSEETQDNYTVYGVSYLYNSSNPGESILNDKEIAEILSKIHSDILKDFSKEPVALSEYLSAQEILAFEKKGFDPYAIDVSVVEATVTPECLEESQRGADTTSYTKSINFNVISVLGTSSFRVGATWNVNIPTGNITIISSWLTHNSGPTGSYWKYAESNRIHTYFAFFNGSVEHDLDFHFRVTTGGSIFQYYP